MVQGERIGIVGPNGAGKTTLLRLVQRRARADARARGARHQDAGSRTSIRRAPRCATTGRSSTTSPSARAPSATAAARWTIGDAGARPAQLPRALPVRRQQAAAEGRLRSRAASARAWRWPRRCAAAPTCSARRADQRPRRGDARRARGAARGVAGLRARRLARSLVPEPRGDLDPGVRGRRARSCATRATTTTIARSARRRRRARRSARSTGREQGAVHAAAGGADAAEAARCPQAAHVRGEARARRHRGSRSPQAEAELARLEAALSDPATYSQGRDAQKRAHAAYEAARAEVARLTARWEALEARSQLKR